MISHEYYIKIMPSLRRYAMALVRGQTDAEELVNRTLVKVLEYNRKNPDIIIKNLESFSIRVLRNIFLDDKRKGLDPVDPEIDPEDETLPSDILLDDKIQKAFKSVKSICREIFALQAQDNNYKDIAEKLCKPINTIKTNISRCRMSLKTELIKLGIGPELKEMFPNG